MPLNMIRSALLKRRALNFFVTGDFKRSYESFRKFCDLNPGDTGMVYNMGLTCIALRRYDEAEKYLTGAVSEGHPGLLRTMGDLYYLWGKREKAMEWYGRALSDGPEGEKTLMERRIAVCGDPDKYQTVGSSYRMAEQGSALMYEKKYEQALSLFKDAAEKDDTNFIALNNIGTILMNVMGRHKEALKYFQAAGVFTDNPVIKKNIRRAEEYLEKEDGDA